MTKAKITKVFVWTDGGASPNPGKGAWACALIAKDHGKLLAGPGSWNQDTNNQMEATGLLEALKCLKYPCMVHVCTDSEYLIKCMKIIRRGVQQKTGELPVKNKKLWKEIQKQYIRHVAVRLEHELAHQDDTPILQQYCDYMVRQNHQVIEKQDPFIWQGPAQELYERAYETCRS